MKQTDEKVTEVYSLGQRFVNMIKETKYPARKDDQFIGPFTWDNITVGKRSYFQSDCILIATEGNSITIGDDCAIGHWCYLATKMHQTQDHTKRFYGDITIEDHCWLGNGVIVYPGVTIGKDSIIGAHVVVTHDVPEYSIARNYQQVISRKIAK